MFEEFNEYGAFQYGSMGRKVAAYNTKLKKSLLLEMSGKKFATAVLVHPYQATNPEKQMLERKAEKEGQSISAYISEPVAATLYYTAQNLKLNRTGLVRVLNVHKDRTEVSYVKVQKDGITVEFHQSILGGSELLVEKMTEFYTKKLRHIDGDVLNYAKERCVLYSGAKEAMFRLTSNRLEEDKFIYASPKTGKEYQLTMKRIEFDTLVRQVAEEFLKKIEKTDHCCHGTALCGGLCEYETFVDAVRAKYQNMPVAAYKSHEAEVLGAALYARQVCQYQSKNVRY